ncbi:MAG: calcium/sodium antiporter [Gammaproteobacteria bacterium]|nr:calcium/sodium antiporter [Gammaproteobacteria bacterium]
MIWNVIAVLAGFILLMWGADRFVAGAACAARLLGVSTLIIGLTIVGFGTSAPEILVSAMASIAGNPGLAMGNAIGSNITNIALILGFTAVVTPLTVRSETLRRELPLLMAIMLVSVGLLADRELDRIDGILLLLALVGFLVWLVRLGMASKKTDPMIAEFQEEIPRDMSMGKAIFWLVAGLVVLLASSRLLVWGAVNIAEGFGVSDLIIGLTIVAIGTSLPELAASVVAARKGEHDIAIGNVLGSNIFNLLAVMGLPGVIMPGSFEPEVLSRDFPVMIFLTLLFFGLAYGIGGVGRITRPAGAVLLACFAGYQLILYFGILA